MPGLETRSYVRVPLSVDCFDRFFLFANAVQLMYPSVGWAYKNARHIQEKKHGEKEIKEEGCCFRCERK